MLLLLAAQLAAAPSEVNLNWVSHNGDVALLGGGGFSNGSSVTLRSGSSDEDAAETTAPALDVSEAALKFRVPSATSAYDVSVDGSAPLCLNLADPWWWQVRAAQLRHSAAL